MFSTVLYHTVFYSAVVYSTIFEQHCVCVSVPSLYSPHPPPHLHTRWLSADRFMVTLTPVTEMTGQPGERMVWLVGGGLVTLFVQSFSVESYIHQQLPSYTVCLYKQKLIVYRSPRVSLLSWLVILLIHLHSPVLVVCPQCPGIPGVSTVPSVLNMF